MKSRFNLLIDKVLLNHENTQSSTNVLVKLKGSRTPLLSYQELNKSMNKLKTPKYQALNPSPQTLEIELLTIHGKIHNKYQYKVHNK